MSRRPFPIKMTTVAIKRMAWFFLSIILSSLLLILAYNSTEHYSKLAFWFMLYLNVVIFGLIIKTSHLEIDFLEPYYVVLFLFTLYIWTSALAEVINRGDRISIMPIYYQCAILGIFGFILGYQYIHCSKLDLVRSLVSFSPSIYHKKYYKIVLLSAIVFAIFNYKNLINIFNIGNISPYTEVAASNRVGRTESFGFVSYMQQLSILFILGSLFIKSFVQRKLSIGSTIVFGIYAVFEIMAGGKSVIIAFITLLLIYYNYIIRRLRFTPVFICTLLLLMFVTIFSVVRSTTSIPEMVKIASAHYEESLLFLTPLRNGEFIGPPRTLMNVIDSIQNGYMDFSFGSTYISELAIFIPKIFYSDRPLPMSERYMEIFHPGSLAEGMGEGSSMLTEGYWAFGHAGVFIAMFIYGAVVSIYYKILKRNLNNGVMIFIYYLAFFPLITTATRTGLIGAFKGTAMAVLPFFLILCLSIKHHKVGHFPNRREPEIMHGSKIAAS
ncbi:MAG: O-antigen polymerase [Syntrophales bacterium]